MITRRPATQLVQERAGQNHQASTKDRETRLTIIPQQAIGKSGRMTNQQSKAPSCGMSTTDIPGTVVECGYLDLIAGS